MMNVDWAQLIFWFYSFVALWSAITIYKTSIEAIDKKRFGECLRNACISAVYGLIWPITIILLVALWMSDRKNDGEN